MIEGPTIGDWTQYGWIPDGASSFPARVRLRDAAWMVYYEANVGDERERAEMLELREQNAELRDENAKLRDEVERLHADQAHWELGNCPSCPNVADLQEALEQNAKLRELVTSYLRRVRSPVGPTVERDYMAEFRALGIEVY